MLKQISKVSLGLPILSAITLCTLAVAPSASAFTFDYDIGRVGIDGTADVNSTFKVLFDGNSNTQNVKGLSSNAIFKFLGFNAVGSGANTKTEAAFEITLDDTSNDGITSRVSALGFNVLNFDGTNFGSKLPLVGVGSPSGTGNTRSEGLFTNDRSGSFPNQFGNVDVCFTDGNTCQGGSNGGVKTAEPPGKFKATLAFNGSVNKFAMSNFGVRYQSIDGINSDQQSFKGDSGTGKGKFKKPKRHKIPEPGTVGAILLAGFGMLSKNRKRQQEENQAAV